MWPWRRTPPEPVPAPLSAPEPVAAPLRRDAWRSLPVIQRTIGDHPLVDPPGRFGASLGSWQDPSYLAPLGHAVGPDEPAGLIGELAVPVGEPRVRDESPPDLPVATPPPTDPPRRGLAAVLQRLIGTQPPAPPPAPPTTAPSPRPEPVPVSVSPGESVPPSEPGPTSEPGTSGEPMPVQRTAAPLTAAPETAAPQTAAPGTAAPPPAVAQRATAPGSSPVPARSEVSLPTRPLPGGTGAETPTPRAVQRLADSAPVVPDPPATSSPPPAEPPTMPPSYDEPDEQPAMAEEPSPASAADPPAEAPESAPTLGSDSVTESVPTLGHEAAAGQRAVGPASQATESLTPGEADPPPAGSGPGRADR